MTTNTRSFLLMIFLSITFFFVQNVFAQSPVTLLSPLPGVTGGAVSFDDYVPLVFKLAIGVAGVLAVIMIIIGGLQYMSTDAITGKSEGRNKITSALMGLVLVLAAYIILQQINPALVQFGLPGIPVIVTTTAVPPSGGPPPRTITNCSPINNNLCVSIKASGVRVSDAACAPPVANCDVGATPDFVNKLQDMDTDLMGKGHIMHVTEGYPPTVTHQNICHQNGTCVDYNFIGQTGPALTSKVNAVITAAEAAGLRAVYEVQNSADCKALRAAGVRATSVFVVPGINNPHFSIYQPGVSNGAGTNC